MKEPVPASEIRGTLDLFVPFYEKLRRGTDRELLRLVEGFLDALKKDLTIGVKVPHSLWPKRYIKKYGITNLWKYDVGLKHRAVYTIVAEGQNKIGIVIEFMTHKMYNERFSYAE